MKPQGAQNDCGPNLVLVNTTSLVPTTSSYFFSIKHMKDAAMTDWSSFLHRSPAKVFYKLESKAPIDLETVVNHTAQATQHQGFSSQKFTYKLKSHLMLSHLVPYIKHHLNFAWIKFSWLPCKTKSTAFTGGWQRWSYVSSIFWKRCKDFFTAPSKSL